MKPAEVAGDKHSQTTARGTVQLLIGRGLFMVSGYVITVLLARGLGPVAYGAYGIVMSLLLWLEVASDAGIQRATIKLIPESSDADAVARASTVLLLGVSLALLAACWIAAPGVAAYFGLENGAWLFRLAILDLPFNGVYLACQGILQGRRQFATLSVTLVVYSAAKVGGIALLVMVGLSVEAALIVNVMATVAALAFLWFRGELRIARPDGKLLKQLSRIAAPLGVSVIAMQFLLSVHLWSLKRLSGAPDETVGYYVAALNLARLPTVVPFVLTGVVLATISAALAQQDHALAKRYMQAAVRFLLILLLPVCVLGALDATPIMVFVFSEEYADGGPLLALLLIAFGLFSVLDTLLHAMIADGLQHQVMAGLLALVLVALGLNALLIPAFGALGAAGSFTLCLALGTVVAIVWSYRRFGESVELRTVVRTVIATTIAALVGVQIDATGLWLVAKLSGLLVVYGAILGLLREIGPRDLSAFAVWKRG